MLRLRTTEAAPLVVDQLPKAPLIYLDQCAVSKLQSDELLNNKFVKTLKEKEGSLCVSWVNFLETQPLDPASEIYLSRMRFYARFDLYWHLIDPNPSKVISKENQWKPNKLAPFLDDNLTTEYFSHWAKYAEIAEHPTIDMAFKFLLMDSKTLDQKKQELESFKVRIKKIIDKGRKLYRSNPRVKSNVDLPLSPPPQGIHITNYFYSAIFKMLISGNDNFELNDAADFFHVVVPSAHCEFAIYDSKWAKRLQQINWSGNIAKIYNVSQLNDFMEDLSEFDAPETVWRTWN